MVLIMSKNIDINANKNTVIYLKDKINNFWIDPLFTKYFNIKIIFFVRTLSKNDFYKVLNPPTLRLLKIEWIKGNINDEDYQILFKKIKNKEYDE